MSDHRVIVSVISAWESLNQLSLNSIKTELSFSTLNIESLSSNWSVVSGLVIVDNRHYRYISDMPTALIK